MQHVRCHTFDLRISENTTISYSRQTESIQVTSIVVIFLLLRFAMLLLPVLRYNLSLIDEISYFNPQSHVISQNFIVTSILD